MRTNIIIIECLRILHVLETEIASEQITANGLILFLLLLWILASHRSAGNKDVLPVRFKSWS